VLVHCTQGVSRSCSFCIAYMMLYERLSYEDGYRTLKARRGICNPNAGFSSQLVLWGRRIGLNGEKVVNRPRAFCIDRYYRHDDSAGLVPMELDTKSHIMDASAVYFIDATECMWIWEGADVKQRDAAMQVAQCEIKHLQTYEGSCKGNVILVKQDEEPEGLITVLKTMSFLLPSEATPVVPMETESSGRHDDDEDIHQKHQEAQPEQGHMDAETNSHRAPAPEDKEPKRSAVAFPQGGLPCEVQTPRGERPPTLGIPNLKSIVPALAPTVEHADDAGWRNVSFVPCMYAVRILGVCACVRNVTWV
jgi:hypothetical protein